MLREIIEIDLDLCNGCGDCVPNCHEGALQIINGKARLISDLMCDGLGACVGHCPTGAMTVVKREAEPYDERTVMLENIIPAGPDVIRAHLEHLAEHGEMDFLMQAKTVLKENDINLPDHSNTTDSPGAHGGGCPGAAARSFKPQSESVNAQAQSTVEQGSELRQWPLQLHLVNPLAPYFKSADLLLSADCVSYALGDFHSKHLKGKSLAIACPKLDQGQDIYINKLTTMIDESKINTLTVMVMEVPCCQGLLQMARTAASQASRKIPIKKMVVSIEGQIIGEEWV